MENQEFRIEINASREKVWNSLWDDDTYREWTSVFSEGSRAETDWKKGSKVLFLDGSNTGLVSEIAENIPGEFMSIKHLGVIENGVEKTSEWAGAMENYTLHSVNGKTEVIVTIDITDEYKEYFLKTWPIALQKLKEIAER